MVPGLIIGLILGAGVVLLLIRPRISALQVLHSGARVRFTSWFFGEVYLEKGDDLQGGAGLTLALTL